MASLRERIVYLINRIILNFIAQIMENLSTERLFLFSLTTEMSAGQSDRHNQICAFQNTTNRVFVPVNDRDGRLFPGLHIRGDIYFCCGKIQVQCNPPFPSN
jgi:hypothetical protein